MGMIELDVAGRQPRRDRAARHPRRRALGLRTVAVYTDVDRAAPHVREADEALRIGPAPATESYLDIDGVVDAARRDAAPTRSTPATASSPSAPRSRARRRGAG